MYARNAANLIDALRAEFPHFEYLTNISKPRSKSFEIVLVKNENEGKLIWHVYLVIDREHHISILCFKKLYSGQELRKAPQEPSSFQIPRRSSMRSNPKSNNL